MPRQSFRETFLWYFERSPLFADALRTEVLTKIDDLLEGADSWPKDELGIHYRILAKRRTGSPSPPSGRVCSAGEADSPAPAVPKARRAGACNAGPRGIPRRCRTLACAVPCRAAPVRPACVAEEAS